MTDEHHSFRIPLGLWRSYALVVGDVGRTDDLKLYMDWQIDNPDEILGPDVDEPVDFAPTLRVETARWELFAAAVGERQCSARLRSYIWWRVQNPGEPLPGRRVPPLRRQSRRPACV